MAMAKIPLGYHSKPLKRDMDPGSLDSFPIKHYLIQDYN